MRISWMLFEHVLMYSLGSFIPMKSSCDISLECCWLPRSLWPVASMHGNIGYKLLKSLFLLILPSIDSYIILYFKPTFQKHWHLCNYIEFFRCRCKLFKPCSLRYDAEEMVSRRMDMFAMESSKLFTCEDCELQCWCLNLIYRTAEPRPFREDLLFYCKLRLHLLLQEETTERTPTSTAGIQSGGSTDLPWYI